METTSTQSQFQNPGEQSFARELRRFEQPSATAERSPHDQQLLRTLSRLGSNRLGKRRKEAQRLLRENGATFNDFDTVNTPRYWQFDPVPLIIGHQDWSRIEQGLIQRAELFDLILKDIYGPRDLIARGILPPELVFTHHGFLWPCVGLIPAEQRHLNLYSANLAKGKDGRFWVLEDFSQPPFGSGYSLENRIVMTRSFARLFQGFQVHRLAMYFRALRNRLAQLARHNQSEPGIVVLTPGPEHPGYFEHAYLASYIGCPLVQGADLVVRNSCVWLKSVGGLRQIDVILRRLADEYCDPLELRNDSMYGVPGLLEAIRLGNCVTANAIGSEVMQNPALMAFLPGLARLLLGEELLLPSVATWWCGQQRERDFVLQHLNELIISPIHPLPGLPKSVPGQLTAAQQEEWHKRITASPHLFVGQEFSTLTTVPAFVTDKIEERPCTLSIFLTAHEQSYVAMPGGLARVNEDEGRLLVDKSGGYSKDTWVLTNEPDTQVNLWRSVRSDQLIEPLIGPLPSRTAENLYWAGRYAERSEATARLLRSILMKFREYGGFHDPDDRNNLEHLLRALTHVTLTYPGFVGKGAREKLADPRTELMSLARDVDRPGSLRSSLKNFGQAAYIVRDVLPTDAWRIVDNIQQNWNPRFSITQIGSGRLHDSIDQLLVQLAAFSGLNNDNMGRETDWLLLKIGRSLERALNLIALLRATLVPYFKPSMEAQMFETVLANSNSLITYRRRYRSFMQLPTILELLLYDETYPRALAYQLRQLQRMIGELPDNRQGDRGRRQDTVLIEDILVSLGRSEPKALTQVSRSTDSYPLLEELLVQQKQLLEKLSEALASIYFSPSQVPQRLGSVRLDRAS